MAKEEVKEGFKLPNEKVWIKPNLRNPGWIKKPNHRAFFKMEGTFDRLGVPLLRSGGLVNVLTDDEKDYLEDRLSMDKNSLSVYKKAGDNYWHDFFVTVGKEPIPLDLSKPTDYIKYKVVLANEDLVAESVGKLRDKQTFKYYIERPNEVAELKAKQTNVTKEAWIAYAKMESDKRKLVGVLKVYGESFTDRAQLKRITEKDSKLEFLQGLLQDEIEKDPTTFLNVLKDKHFDTRLMIANAVDKGAIKRKGTKYYEPDATVAFANSLKEACQYLEAPANLEFKEKLELQIEE